MRYPGEVWFLPPEAEDEGDPKWRRHVLLTACDESRDEGAVLAYASSKATEAGYGAAHLFFDPDTTAYGRSGRAGFDQATYVYPVRLVAADPADLRRLTGRLIDEMAELRARLHDALGLGTGTTGAGDAARGSWRGRIVRLDAGYAARTGFDLALVVTDPRYSTRRRYQVIVPLVTGVEPEPGEVPVRDRPWLARIAEGLGFGVLVVPFVHSVFHGTRIAADTAIAVDRATMMAVDDALRVLFGLPSTDGAARAA